MAVGPGGLRIAEGTGALLRRLGGQGRSTLLAVRDGRAAALP